MTRSANPLRPLILEVFAAVLERLDPERMTREALQRRPLEPTRVIALGKAAPAMARGAAEALGPHLVEGLVVTDHLEAVPDRYRLVIGSHPRPDERSLSAGRRMLDFIERGGQTRVVALVSGGGSALAEVPVSGLSIEEIADVARRLGEAGTPIAELNTVRRHLSQIKNGRLAARSTAQRLLTLVLSDAVGGPVSDVASGPTLADASTPDDALAVLQRRLGDVPPAIRRALSTKNPVPTATGEVEVPIPTDLRGEFERLRVRQ